MIQRPKFSLFQFRPPILIRLVALTLLIKLNVSPATETTIYVGRHFEVRDHDQPTKYVFNGDTRVARIAGSLTTNARIQRLHLESGWNLRSLAVTATNALRQITNSQFSILNSQSVFGWDPPAQTWLTLSPDDTLPPGSILWLHATTNTTIAVTGAYVEPTNRTVAAGGAFVPGSGLEALTLPVSGMDLALWRHDAANQMWNPQPPAVPGSDPAVPQFLPPGGAAFVDADTPVELEIPPAALRVRYYHQDHLGSSSVMTDANGAIIEETSFYPFGVQRHAHRARQVEESYGFTQKERDRETGLHYFEARYLAGTLSRFATADPKYACPDGLSSDEFASFLSNPQGINLFSYALNNPVKYTDPTGLEQPDAWFRGVMDSETDWGQTLITLSGPVGNAAARVANFVGGTDFDTRSLLAQGVTAVSGSETAGDVTEAVAATVIGGGGVRATVKGVGVILRSPVAAAKGAWNALKQDIGLIAMSKPSAANSVAGTAATSGPSFARPQTLPGVTPFRQPAGLTKEEWAVQTMRDTRASIDAVYKQSGIAVGDATSKKAMNRALEQADTIYGPDILPGD